MVKKAKGFTLIEVLFAGVAGYLAISLFRDRSVLKQQHRSVEDYPLGFTPNRSSKI